MSVGGEGGGRRARQGRKGDLHPPKSRVGVARVASPQPASWTRKLLTGRATYSRHFTSFFVCVWVGCIHRCIFLLLKILIYMFMKLLSSSYVFVCSGNPSFFVLLPQYLFLFLALNLKIVVILVKNVILKLLRFLWC